MSDKKQNRIRKLFCKTKKRRRDEDIAKCGRKDLNSHQQNMSRQTIENFVILQSPKF